MRVAIGSDHAGFQLKETLKTYLTGLLHSVLDLGTYSTDPVDYPDFAEAVGLAVRHGDAERGIMIYGSGVGGSIAAKQDSGDSGGGLSRHVLGSPGG